MKTRFKLMRTIADKIETIISQYPLIQYAFCATSELVFSEKVRHICETECERYGKSWSCPPGVGEAPELSLLQDDTEVAIINKLQEYEEEIDRAAAEYAPQRIARYAYELAGCFHSFYNQCRILGVDDKLAEARLALVNVTAHTIRHALGILGVSAPEKM